MPRRVAGHVRSYGDLSGYGQSYKALISEELILSVPLAGLKNQLFIDLLESGRPLELYLV